MFLGKYRSNTIENLIFKALINSYISHDEFFSVNNLLRKHNETKHSALYAKTMEEKNLNVNFDLL